MPLFARFGSKRERSGLGARRGCLLRRRRPQAVGPIGTSADPVVNGGPAEDARVLRWRGHGSWPATARARAGRWRQARPALG